MFLNLKKSSKYHCIVQSNNRQDFLTLCTIHTPSTKRPYWCGRWLLCAPCPLYLYSLPNWRFACWGMMTRWYWLADEKASSGWATSEQLSSRWGLCGTGMDGVETVLSIRFGCALMALRATPWLWTDLTFLCGESLCVWVCGGGTNVSYSCRCESIIHEMFRPGSHFFGGGDHHQAGSVLVVVSRAILWTNGERERVMRDGVGVCLVLCSEGIW